MRQRYVEIQAKDGDVVGVSFETRDRLLQLSRQLQLPFALLSDPERDVYRAYGLERGGWLQVFSRETLWAYLKHFLRGGRYYHRRSDLKQLGGDFVLDENGKVIFEYRSIYPHDRPSVSRLIEELRSGAG